MAMKNKLHDEDQSEGSGSLDFNQDESQSSATTEQRPSSGEKAPRRKRVRVELIKENDQPDDSGDDENGTPEENAPAEKSADTKGAPERAHKANQQRRNQGKRGDSRNGGRDKKPDEGQQLSINDLTLMDLQELRELAAEKGLQKDSLISMKKQEIIWNAIHVPEIRLLPVVVFHP